MPVDGGTGGAQGGAVPEAVLADVRRVVGTDVTVRARLSGGLNGGAVRVALAGRPDAVLKTTPRMESGALDATLRARRIVARMRDRGYPTPAWLAVGATATHVWHLTDLVDGAPVQELTPSVVEQLLAVVELQAGQGSETHDHAAYAWTVASGREPAAADLGRHSPAVSALVERLPSVRTLPPRLAAAPDMVHADLNPSNVLVRDGEVVAVVDVENAGRGTRATDLTTLQWHAQSPASDGVREQLWTTILDLVGWDGAAVLTTTQVLLQLAWTVGSGRPDLVDEAVERGRRALDELAARR